jgi:hypothetical protein
MLKLTMVALLAAIVFMADSTTAELYYWKDENGVKRFSNEPPPEGVDIILEAEELEHDQATEEAGTKKEEELLKQQEAIDLQRAKQEELERLEKQAKKLEKAQQEKQKAQQAIEDKAIMDLEKEAEKKKRKDRRRRKRRRAVD